MRGCSNIGLTLNKGCEGKKASMLVSRELPVMCEAMTKLRDSSSWSRLLKIHSSQNDNRLDRVLPL